MTMRQCPLLSDRRSYKACSSASNTKSVCMMRLTQANSTLDPLRKQKLPKINLEMYVNLPYCL